MSTEKPAVPLMAHIEHLIQKSAEIEKTSQELAEKYRVRQDSWANPFEENSIKWAFESMAAERELDDYLNQLDYDTLLKLESLMYFGRDRGRLVKRLRRTFEHFAGLNDSKEEITGTIVEKRGSYPVYFKNAIHSLQRKGFDPDSVWEKISESKVKETLPMPVDSQLSVGALDIVEAKEEDTLKKKCRRNPAQVILPWDEIKLVRQLGRGGNGEVWLCESRTGEPSAVKFLIKSKNKKRYDRFKSEIALIEEISPRDGIIPILRSYLPYAPTHHNIPCYMMPVSKPIHDVIKEGVVPIVEMILQLALTLAHLHEQGISHRDLKPANILWLEQWCLSDFGLAKWPGRHDLTSNDEIVGPIWTIAPEMRRTAAGADGRPADVYSLAKTLWILLTKQTKGFDGQYDSDIQGMSLRSLVNEEYLRPIDSLLSDCTSYNPDSRPSMGDVVTRLREWLRARADSHERCLLEWKHMQKLLFPRRQPHRALWNNSSTIAEILKVTISGANLNYLFFHGGGGLELKGARFIEPDLMELNISDIIHLVRPLFLEVVFWHDAPEWSYFWLELSHLEPSGIYEYINEDDSYEEVVELPDGRLLPRWCWDEDGYEDEHGEVDLPEGSRLLVRQLHGAMVAFAKMSKYNADLSTDDGRHSVMGHTAFYDYIKSHVVWVRQGRKGLPQVPLGGPPPVGFRWSQR